MLLQDVENPLNSPQDKYLHTQRTEYSLSRLLPTIQRRILKYFGHDDTEARDGEDCDTREGGWQKNERQISCKIHSSNQKPYKYVNSRSNEKLKCER